MTLLLTGLAALLVLQLALFLLVLRPGNASPIATRIDALERFMERSERLVREDLARQRESNEHTLEEIRATVDERLHQQLERRLGESFQQVAERLEQVHRGLGEMQTLATGIGDLKRVMSNVKARGGYGELRLETLIEQMLSPEQFVKNARPVPGSDAVVEFAIRLPGRERTDSPVLLPVDAKFPLEDYDRLIDAQERADADAAETAAKALVTRVKQCARDIASKYIAPPHTTDFGIMFVPTEGLFAEIVRRPGLVESLQRDMSIVVAGPTTFAALLNSLQMGFRTLAIERRSSEVWSLLATVRGDLERFSQQIDAARRKLDDASSRLDDASRRSRALGRSLSAVETQVPESHVAAAAEMVDGTV